MATGNKAAIDAALDSLESDLAALRQAKEVEFWLTFSTRVSAIRQLSGSELMRHEISERLDQMVRDLSDVDRRKPRR